MSGFIEKAASSPTMVGVVTRSKEDNFKAKVLVSPVDYNWRSKSCERLVLLVLQVRAVVTVYIICKFVLGYIV